MEAQGEKNKKVIDFSTLTLIILLFIFVIAIFEITLKYAKDQKLNWISNIFAQEISPNSQTNDLSNKIREYQQKLSELNQQKNTLASQIQYMDTQITITALRIQQTEKQIETTQKEIKTLSEKITSLDNSLNHLSKVLLQRIVEGYKKRSISLLNVFFDAKNANDFLNQVKYLKTAQENNQKLLVQVQGTKYNFEEQKKIREQKKIDLDKLTITLNEQKQALGVQKVQKQKLLLDTDNDEKKYQDLLSKAQAEYAAIQGIITSGGNEVEISFVKKNDFIASIIPGASCNSSGAHTHFIVKDNGIVSNPFNYLKPISFNNCSGSSCGSSDGDSFNPSGNLDWPLEQTIELEQGYGSTWSVRNTWVGRIYSFHNGIDINGAKNDIRAISDGTLYKGSYSGVNGCALPYVKLVHKDSNIITYYLHVYPK